MNLYHRRATSFAAFLSIFAAMLLLGIAGPAIQAARAVTPRTTVSLTFDDGNAGQYKTAFPILKQYGLHGAFSVITGDIGKSWTMSLSQLLALYRAGNEIASHTVAHPFLTQVSTAEARRQICRSRNALLNWGFPVTDFAYPHSAYNKTLEGIVRTCGYNSARVNNKIKSPYMCPTCPLAEKIPPPDPYAIRTPTSILNTWPLSAIKSEVTRAENNGGGWIVLTFHHVCSSGCGSYSVTPATFRNFLAWLKTQNVSVKTVRQVIGGPVRPPVSAALRS